MSFVKNENKENMWKIKKEKSFNENDEFYLIFFWFTDSLSHTRGG